MSRIRTINGILWFCLSIAAYLQLLKNRIEVNEKSIMALMAKEMLLKTYTHIDSKLTDSIESLAADLGFSKIYSRSATATVVFKKSIKP